MAIKNDMRSWKLEPHELEALKEYVKDCITLQFAANKLKIDRDILDKTIAKGSCHPKTYNKLKKVFVVKPAKVA